MNQKLQNAPVEFILSPFGGGGGVMKSLFYAIITSTLSQKD